MGATEIESRFSCGACGKGFRWKPDIAGKKAKCACGAAVSVPAADPGASHAAADRPDVSADLSAEPEAAIPVAAVVGTAPVPVGPPPVTKRSVATRATKVGGIEYARRKNDRQHDLDAQMSVWGAPEERKVPLIVLGVSTLIYLTLAVIEHQHVMAITVYSIAMFIRVGIMVLAAHAVAKFAGTSFGVLGIGIIKLAAVCVVCEAIRDLGAVIGIGGAALAWMVALITFYTLLVKWFEMTLGEAMLTAITAWAMNWIAAMIIVAMLVSMTR